MTQNIENIKTGQGIAGARVAIIFAPKNAPSGSMVALTRFLNQHEHIRAVPGYHGPDKNHVLRVSGFRSDDELKELLLDGLPAWAAEQTEHYDGVSLSPDIQFSDITDVDHFPHKATLQRFVKENSNTMAGLSYMVGNVGLLFSALRAPKSMPGHPAHDWFKTYSAIAYSFGSAVLISLAHHADNPRDVYSIMEETYPRLSDASDAEKEQVKSTINKAFAFMQNHPWEISSAIYATGAGAHLTSALRRRSHGGKNVRFEALSAMGTLVAMVLRL